MHKAIAALMCVAAVETADAAKPAVKAVSELPADWYEYRASRDPAIQKLVTRIDDADWWANCLRFGTISRAKAKTLEFAALRAYLTDLKHMNGVDWMNVDRRTVQIGMTSCGIIAALGRPSAVNRTTTALGRSEQWVYRDRGIYVYTEQRGNGAALVTSFQD